MRKSFWIGVAASCLAAFGTAIIASSDNRELPWWLGVPVAMVILSSWLGVAALVLVFGVFGTDDVARPNTTQDTGEGV